VVDFLAPGEDEGMRDTVRAWAVELGRGSMREREGSLSLDVDALAFEAKDGYSHLRIGFAEIRRARRLRGSPVLMIVHGTEGRRDRTAFYFVQPPPLQPVLGSAPERPGPLSIGRNSARKARRQNTGYLGLWNRQKKVELAQWERAIRSAIEAAQSREH